MTSPIRQIPPERTEESLATVTEVTNKILLSLGDATGSLHVPHILASYV